MFRDIDEWAVVPEGTDSAGDPHYRAETRAGTGVYGRIWDIGGAFGIQPVLRAHAPGRPAFYANTSHLVSEPDPVGNVDPPFAGRRDLGHPSVPLRPAHRRSSRTAAGCGYSGKTSSVGSRPRR